MKSHPLPIYVQRFFTERLATQLHASPNTVASYRDTFRLLLRYAADRLKRQPTQLQIADIDAELIGSFLTFVETRRGNVARSRNTRLRAPLPESLGTPFSSALELCVPSSKKWIDGSIGEVFGTRAVEKA